MTHYVGIDLGTTNSAITTFDGENITLYKSPDQKDVTPSAIFIDRRGNKYIGARGYDQAAQNPDSAAVLFKRMMGTKTPVKLPGVNLVMTPEECSAEILRVLFGYLPEELRNDPDTGTVITVPAAFNQMQKDATMAAAEAAGLGKVALMQEPVAAVMSVMRQRKTDGIFLVFDLGGGTLDIAIAQSTGGRVSLMAHGGIAMCGGRDFDRLILDNVVKPWLLDEFDLPEDFAIDKKFSRLVPIATWAVERAKIELSNKEEAIIGLDDSEVRTKDRKGNDIYVDIPLKRETYDQLISDLIEEAVAAAHGTIEKTGYSAHDIGRVVFVGGPTQYKPLRDKVSFELGIAPSTDVNPMTAVAEGAAVFAESIDWSTQNRTRKQGRGELSAGGDFQLTFAYNARTPEDKALVIAKLKGKVIGNAAFQVDSLDTGWTSGRVPLSDGASVELLLSKSGENTFKVFVFDGAGGAIKLPKDKITITRTAAQIDAIPASHSIGIEAREKLGGRFILDYLVKEGDPLPRKGTKTFKADQSLRAGATGGLVFKLWEGDIDYPVDDNRFIGVFEINGADFADAAISKGDDLVVDYTVLDSGNIVLEVTVPSIGGTFKSGYNFYSSSSAQVDYTDAAKLVSEEASKVSRRIGEISKNMSNSKLDEAKNRVEGASAKSQEDNSPENAKKAMDEVQNAKKLLAQFRKDNLKTMRQIDLDGCVGLFNGMVRKHARPIEETAFDNLVRTAKGVISSPGGDFENHLRGLRGKNWEILFRQDWFVIDRFKLLSESRHLFPNASQHAELARAGKVALEANDIDKLRAVLDHLESSRSISGSEDQLLVGSNILVG